MFRCTLIAYLIVFYAMVAQSEVERAKPEKAEPVKVRVEKHKLAVDVKKLKPVKGKDGKEQIETVTVIETREFPLMFNIMEKAQKHRVKRIEREAASGDGKAKR